MGEKSSEMNVREALEKAIEESCDARDGFFLDVLAPIMEKGLRAAYDEGATELGLFGVPYLNNSHGVAAGVAAMGETGRE